MTRRHNRGTRIVHVTTPGPYHHPTVQITHTRSTSAVRARHVEESTLLSCRHVSMRRLQIEPIPHRSEATPQQAPPSRSLPSRRPTGMAAGVVARVRPHVIPTPHFARRLSSSLTTPTPIPALAATSLDLGDTEQLFAAVPTGSLVRSLAVLCAVAAEPVVDLGTWAMRSPAVMGTAAGKAAVMAAVRGTVYHHFCAGEDVEEAGRTLRRLWEAGLKGILDYGQEDAEDNAACDRNLVGFLTAVATTASLPPSSVSFACVKITAICPIALLERVSDLLRWEKKDPSFHLPWKQKSLPVLADSSPLYHTPAQPHPLTDAEERDLQLAHQRLSTLCQRCTEAKLPLLVDAEYTSVQPAIDYLTFAAAAEFNGGGRPPLVYGTIQAYLKDSKDRMVAAVDAAEKEGVAMGFKLVRGAYLTRENREASALGAASPINDSIQATHRCYNECASVMIQRVAQSTASVVLATHNFESGNVAVAKAEEMGISKGDERLQFSQLLGMADGLSLALRSAGFQVSKYLPFGPVDQVMPYLMRRAEENRGVLSASTFDRELIRKELKRRLKATISGRG